MLAWRARYETQEELNATHKALQEMLKPCERIEESIEIGYPADGKNKHPYLFLEAAKKVPALKLFMSGDDSVAAKHGVTLKALAKKSQFSKNIIYKDRKEFLPELSAFTSVRNELLLRSAFNTVEKLLNPVGSKYAIVGVFHSPYFKKYEAMLEGEYERLVVVKGDEGTPEVIKNAKLLVIDKNKEPFELKVDFEALGLKEITTKEVLSEESFCMLQENLTQDYQSLLEVNAALLAIAAQKADSIEEALAYVRG